MKNPFDVKLETNRVILRKLSVSDAKDMFEYTSNKACSEHLSWKPHVKIDQTENYIKGVIKGYNNSNEFSWAIEEKVQHKFIGVVRIFDVSFYNKRGELSYILNPAFQGKGLMLESIRCVLDYCFKDVGLNRIQARCTPENTASEKIMKSLGMIFEGRLRDYWINKGVFKDALLYAISINYEENNTGK